MRRTVVLAVVALFGVERVEASLIVKDLVLGSNDGLITHDTETGLDWLGLPVTVNYSFEQMVVCLADSKTIYLGLGTRRLQN